MRRIRGVGNKEVAAAPASQGFGSDSESEKLEFIMITGGVHDPAAADWIDDSDLPALPMVVESRTVSAPELALPLKDPKSLR